MTKRGTFPTFCSILLAIAVSASITMFAQGCNTTQSPSRQVSDAQITTQIKSKLLSSRWPRLMRLEEGMDLAHRQGNPLFGLFPGEDAHFGFRREHRALHGDGVKGAPGRRPAGSGPGFGNCARNRASR
jgi:hypothetical protein